MSRTLIQKVLFDDTQSTAPGSLGDLGYKTIVAAESADSIPVDKFITTRWGRVDRGIGPSKPQTLAVWVYNKEKDYLPIDAALVRVRSLLTGIESRKALEGWVSQVRWEGDSEDLRDDGYQAVVKNGTFTVIASTR